MNHSRKVAVRLRFTDAAGAPVPGILVRLSVKHQSPAPPGIAAGSSLEKGPDAASEIAAVQTDAAGYCSVKLDPAVLAGASDVAVTYGGAKSAVRNVTLAQLAASTVQTIVVDPVDNPSIIPHLGLPSIQFADVLDSILSPSSIGMIPQLRPGSGICAQLSPTNPRIRRFPAYTIHADICRTETAACPDAVEFVRGTMLEYEVAWHPAGSALGDLLNTITLAPCEQVNIAVVDWMRREAATQSQSTYIQQQSLQSMNRDRLITETMHSKIMTAGAAAGAAVGVKVPITDKIDLTSSYGASASIGLQQAAITTTSQLSEHIAQAASFVSSERSTVVFQTTASEQQAYQSRTLRNNNHCHTLTMAYYQVNENYRVETTYNGKRDVVLVKYDNTDFDAKRAYCGAEALKPALLDQSLLGGFDELADALFCCVLTEIVTPPKMDYVTITFWVQYNVNPTADATLNGIVYVNQLSVDFSVTEQWQNGSMHQVTVAMPSLINPAEAHDISLWFEETPDATPATVFSKIEVSGHIVGSIVPVVLLSRTDLTINTNQWEGPMRGEVASQVVEKNGCIDKSCAVQKLLGHLNCHKRYYNNLLWLDENPNERVVRWSCCSKDGAGFSMLDQIENEPITVYGDFVVFPAAGSQLDPLPTVDPVVKLITMPTPGVFSEGILGQCNTCETIDPDRFSDWKSSPCPDNAPVITPTLTPQAGANPGSMKADSISNLITLTSVPDAGQSALKDIVAALVTQADSGSKAAQDLLGKLFDSLKTSVTETPAKPSSG